MVVIYQTAFGKLFGNILLVMFYICVFLTLLESTSVEADAMKYNFMLFNPIWGFLLSAVLVGLYVVVSGFRSVVITVCVGIIFISSSGVFLAALTQKYKDFTRLLPVFENGINRGFLLCIVKLVASLASFVIIIPLFKDVTDKKKLMKMSLIGFAFVAEVELFCMIGNITTFEPSLFNTYPFPKLIQTQRIRHFGVLEAGELFVMLQIIGGWIVKYVTSFFIVNHLFRRMGVTSPWVNIFISLIVYGVGSAAAYNIFNVFGYLEIYIYIILANFFIIPILVFSVFALRSKKARVQPPGYVNQPDNIQINSYADKTPN